MTTKVIDACQAPLEFSDQHVLSEWIDFNGHMNVAFYVTLEMHINYIQELHLGDPIRLTCQLLDYDSKRIHYFFNMYHATENYLAATCEQLLLHVNLEERRSSPFPKTVLSKLETLMALHRQLPRPEQAGKPIGIRRR